MEAGPYYICTVGRTDNGRLAVVSFRIPIAPVGRRVWLRMLFETVSGGQAHELVSEIRADPRGFIDSLGGGGPTSRFVAARAVGRFVILTVSLVRRT